MKTEMAPSPPPTIENFNVPLDTRFFIDHDREEVQGTIRDALIITYYKRGELSMGEVAEMKGIPYWDANDWMIAQGVPTMRGTGNKEIDRKAKEFLDKI